MHITELCERIAGIIEHLTHPMVEGIASHASSQRTAPDPLMAF